MGFRILAGFASLVFTALLVFMWVNTEIPTTPDQIIACVLVNMTFLALIFITGGVAIKGDNF